MKNSNKSFDEIQEISFEKASELVQENGAVDRYQALGIPYPDLETMCKGQCEGIGFYPCQNDEEITPLELAAWLDCHNASDAHQDEPCDGWHFITCFECSGTGKAISEIIH